MDFPNLVHTLTNPLLPYFSFLEMFLEKLLEDVALILMLICFQQQRQQHRSENEHLLSEVVVSEDNDDDDLLPINNQLCLAINEER
jgi:hypothetical protein